MHGKADIKFTSAKQAKIHSYNKPLLLHLVIRHTLLYMNSFPAFRLGIDLRSVG